MELKHITETIEGYEVKDLIWLPMDNVIRGLVKCPLWGLDNLHNGFIVCTWRRNGSVMPRYGGNSRKDLYLKISI